MSANRETLWVRVRSRPLAQQVALAVIGVAILLLAIYWLFLRSAAPQAVSRQKLSSAITCDHLGGGELSFRRR